MGVHDGRRHFRARPQLWDFSSIAWIVNTKQDPIHRCRRDFFWQKGQQEVFDRQAAALSESAGHVSVETNIIAYLRMKEAYALACDDTEQAAVTAEEEERLGLDSSVIALVGPRPYACDLPQFRFEQIAALASLLESKTLHSSRPP